MNQILSPLFGICVLLFSPLLAQDSPLPTQASEEGIVLFTPPSGWHMAEADQLPKHVRVMVIGKALSGFPPSMNLSWEPYHGTLRQYLKIVKNMNSAQGYDWKDLGTIQTEAGPASLSQVDTKTQWGIVRLMHVILVKNGHVYILTASALKNEFANFYQNFFSAMRSLRVVKDLYEMIGDAPQRIQLKEAVRQVHTAWQKLLNQKQIAHPTQPWAELQKEVFQSEAFQQHTWKPFIAMLNQKYAHLGAEWISLFQQKTEDQLFHMTI